MGGTNTRVAGSHNLERVDYAGEPIRRRNTHSYENDLDFIIDSAMKVAGRTAVRAVGIGTPGTPSPDRLSIGTAKNLPHWNGQPLVRPISESLDCPVYYDNDAVVGGLGEAYYGQSRTDFHYLIWGTGIGGAAIEYGDDGDVNQVSKLRWKTHFRNWEQDCSGAQITKQFLEAPETFTNERWNEIVRTFGAHLLNYIDSYNPSAIVFGGGLAEKNLHEILDISANAGIDIKVNDSGIKGGFGLIRYVGTERGHIKDTDQDDTEE